MAPSPAPSILENLSNNINEAPVGRRTRRSVNLIAKCSDQSLDSLLALEMDGSFSDKQAASGNADGGGSTSAGALAEQYVSSFNKVVPPKKRGRGTKAVVASAEQNISLLEKSPKKRGRGAKTTAASGRGRGRGRKSMEAPRRTSNDSVNSISSESSTNTGAGDPDYENEQPPMFVANNPNHTAAIMESFLQGGRVTRRGRDTVMRAHREYMAEVAARAKQVDYVDLITSPMIRVEGTIDLDSDNEVEMPSPRNKAKAQKSPKKKKGVSNNEQPTTALDISFDDDNPQLSVKIKWKGKPEAFKLRKYQKFATILRTLAERESTDVKNIVLNLNDRIIESDDTPDTIDYKFFQFIDGRVLAMSNSPLVSNVNKKKRDTNKINLKIQSDKWKRPLQIDIQKTDTFRILYIKCAEELNVGIDKITLSFDGEHLELNDTPADLDLEGGEVIDLRLKDN